MEITRTCRGYIRIRSKVYCWKNNKLTKLADLVVTVRRDRDPTGPCHGRALIYGLSLIAQSQILILLSYLSDKKAEITCAKTQAPMSSVNIRRHGLVSASYAEACTRQCHPLVSAWYGAMDSSVPRIRRHQGIHSSVPRATFSPSCTFNVGVKFSSNRRTICACRLEASRMQAFRFA